MYPTTIHYATKQLGELHEHTLILLTGELNVLYAGMSFDWGSATWRASDANSLGVVALVCTCLAVLERDEEGDDLDRLAEAHLVADDAAALLRV